MALLVVASAAASDGTLRVERAIAEAIRSGLGADARVRVVIGQVRLRDDAGDDADHALVAQPVPGARLGRPTRFTLYREAEAPGQPSVRVGYAVAEAHAAVAHVRTAHAIDRGHVLTEEDIVLADSEVGTVALKPLPTVDDVVGSKLSRRLEAGVLIRRPVLRLPMLVRTGDLVLTRVRVGAVMVAGRATATESGHAGEVIRLLNEDSGRRLQGRVVAPGEVEVVY